MFDIKSAAIVPTKFIHFRTPDTNALMYAGVKEDGTPDTDKPIGVRAYGPGSAVYRKVQGKITTASIAAGKKGLTGESLFENQVKLLAGTVTEFINFEYEGAGASVENTAKFYSNPALVHFKEQTEAEQQDLGGFLPTAASA